MKVTHPAFAFALLLCTAGAGAQHATPQVGQYIHEGGNGTLSVKGNGKFVIKTVGANAHTCGVKGTIVKGSAKLADSSCVVSFTPAAAGGVTVDSQQCREQCGVRASFDGNYIKPVAACTNSAVAARRRSFKRQYDAKYYAAAQATLAPILRTCDNTLGWMDKAWIRNDLALAQARAGNLAACLQTLEPLREDAASTDADIRNQYPPADFEAYLPAVRAARTNLKLCKA